MTKDNKKLRKKTICVFMILSLVLLSGLYVVLNHPQAENHNVSIFLDKGIPLIPFFVIPYLSFYLLIFFTMVEVSTSYNRFKKVWGAFVVCLIVSYTVFYFFQTVVYRPVIINKDIFSLLVNWVYTMDSPYNGLPSLHTSISTICFFYLVFVKKRLRIIFTSWAFLIVLSALFTKQHYILDIIFGLILGSVSSLLLFRKNSSEIS